MTSRRRQPDRVRVRRRRRGPQPQRRLPLHALRARARPADFPLLRPARSEGPVHADARRFPTTGRRWPTAPRSRRTPSGRLGRRIDFRRNAAAADISVQLRGRANSRSRPRTRDGRALRMFHRETDAAKVARNRDAIFDLHASALAWLEDYTAIRYPFGKFDIVLIPSFQFGGMEHAGRDPLQRRRSDAGRVGHTEPAARARQHHRARNCAHVVRRSRDDAVVQRCVDEGGVRELHGREDREPVVSPR